MPGTAEQEALAPGFVLVLLGARADPATGFAEVRARRFEGGVACESVEAAGRMGAEDGAAVAAALRRLAGALAGRPHLLAAWGGAWRGLFAACVEAPLRDGLRAFDLRRAGIAVAGSLRASAGVEDLLRAFAVTGVVDDSPLPPACEEVLWAMLRRAAARGWSLADLVAGGPPAAAGSPPPRHGLDAAALDALPRVPAVYVLHGEDRRVLYVGQTGDLARRMAQHFGPLPEPDAKADFLRRATRGLAFTAVGSPLEALLREQRAIAELRPEMNAQRRVEEGTSRYGAPPGPVAVLAPSARPGRVEVFLFGGEREALQVSVSLARPARAALRRCVAHALGAASRPPRGGGGVVAWGRDGAVICARFFGRARDRLQWTELGGAGSVEAEAERLLGLARVVAGRRPDPGEFRSPARA